MLRVSKWFALILLICSPDLAWADAVAKYGVMIPKECESLSATKAVFVSKQSSLGGPFIKQLEVGGWDDTDGRGRKSSGMASASAGLNVNAGYIFAQALVGPAIISTPDKLLGGRFQFNNDFALGLRDPKTGASIGAAYKHISSAGLEHPNEGRDFILFRVGIPW